MRYYRLIHKESGWNSDRMWSNGVNFPGRLTMLGFFLDNISGIVSQLKADMGSRVGSTKSLKDYNQYVWVQVRIKVV